MLTLRRGGLLAHQLCSSQFLVRECAALTEKAQLEKFFDKINRFVDESTRTRNFAVIQMYTKQRFVKEGDMFYVYKDVPAKVGDRIKIEKVLIFGNEDISLFGRPYLDRDLVHVEAMVLEKTHSHTFMNVVAPKEMLRNFRRWYFSRYPMTIFRVTEVKICHHLNENPSVIK